MDDKKEVQSRPDTSLQTSKECSDSVEYEKAEITPKEKWGLIGTNSGKLDVKYQAKLGHALRESAEKDTIIASLTAQLAKTNAAITSLTDHIASLLEDRENLVADLSMEYQIMLETQMSDTMRREFLQLESSSDPEEHHREPAQVDDNNGQTTKQESTSEDCGYPREASSVNSVAADNSPDVTQRKSCLAREDTELVDPSALREKITFLEEKLDIVMQEIAVYKSGILLSQKDGAYTVEGKVEGVPLNIAIDTGASQTFLNRNIWEKICDKPPFDASETSVCLGDGVSKLKIFGQAMVNLQIGSKWIEHPVHLADIGSHDMYLGFDFFSYYYCQLIREEVRGPCKLIVQNERRPSKGPQRATTPGNLCGAIFLPGKKDSAWANVEYRQWHKCHDGIDLKK